MEYEIEDDIEKPGPIFWPSLKYGQTFRFTDGTYVYIRNNEDTFVSLEDGSVWSRDKDLPVEALKQTAPAKFRVKR